MWITDQFLQIQGEGGSIAATAIKDQTGSIAKKLEFQGVFGTLSTLAQKEGIRAWYQGITAGLQRQMCFVSVRIGLYDVIKQKYCNLFNSKFWNNISRNGKEKICLISNKVPSLHFKLVLFFFLYKNHVFKCPIFDVNELNTFGEI